MAQPPYGSDVTQFSATPYIYRGFTMSFKSLFETKIARRPRAFAMAFVQGALMAGLILSGTALPAAAQDETRPDEIIGDWRLKCLTDPNTQNEACVLLQDIVAESDNKPVMQVAIGFWGPERRRGALITLPLGVILPPGIELSVDGGVVGQVPFFACPPNGCQVHAVLDDNLLNRFKKGNKGLVKFQTRDGQTIPVEFSLSGFTAGFGKIK